MPLSSGNEIKCFECGDSNIFIVFTPVDVYCECTNGHYWREPYQDQGGPHVRPASPVKRLEDLLTTEEITLYQHLIKEIGKDINYFLTADPSDKAKRISNISKANEKVIYNLFKKITIYQNIQKGG